MPSKELLEHLDGKHVMPCETRNTTDDGAGEFISQNSVDQEFAIQYVLASPTANPLHVQPRENRIV